MKTKTLLLLLLAVAAAFGQGMIVKRRVLPSAAVPIALISGSNVQASATGANTATTTAIDTTGATLLVMVLIDGQQSGFGTTFSDSKSNTWTCLTQIDSGGGLSASGRICYVANPTVGSGHTFSAAGYQITIMVSAWSGVKVSTPFDQENGTANAAQSGSITPTENNELVISAYGDDYGSGALSIDGGFTILNTKRGNDGTKSGGAAYLIQTTAAATNPTWSGGTTDKWAVIASFKKQ